MEALKNLNRVCNVHGKIRYLGELMEVVNGSEAPPANKVQEQLERVLASQGFANAARLRDLLRFLVAARLPAASGLRTWEIGTEVFGRPDHDPRESSTVRTTANRLRKVLGSYYDADGRDDPVLISLPDTGYLPQFTWLMKPAAELPPHVPEPPPPAGESKRRFKSLAGIAAVIITVLAIAGSLTAFLLNRIDSKAAQPIASDQLTTDGRYKKGPLLTDGGVLVFSEKLGADLFPASVPVNGEYVTQIADDPPRPLLRNSPEHDP